AGRGIRLQPRNCEERPLTEPGLFQQLVGIFRGRCLPAQVVSDRPIDGEVTLSAFQKRSIGHDACMAHQTTAASNLYHALLTNHITSKWHDSGFRERHADRLVPARVAHLREFERGAIADWSVENNLSGLDPIVSGSQS